MDIGRFEQDVRDTNHRRSFIDRIQQPACIDSDAVLRWDDLDPGRKPALLVDQVENRREVHSVGDNLGPALRKVEGAENDGVGQCDVRLEHDFPRVCADQGRDQVAHISGQGPPRFLPDSHASCRPALVIVLEARPDRCRHRPQRIADQIVGLGEDRKFASVGQERIRMFSDRLTPGDRVHGCFIHGMLPRTRSRKLADWIEIPRSIVSRIA